jgi:hypothetical protein
VRVDVDPNDDFVRVHAVLPVMCSDPFLRFDLMYGIEKLQMRVFVSSAILVPEEYTLSSHHPTCQ